MNIIKKLFVRQEKRWENNPLAQLIIYIPASIISSILIIPLFLISLPFLIFNKKIQKNVLKFLITIQHTISLSFWYILFKILFPKSLIFPFWITYLITILVVYIGFKKTIEKFTNESLEKAGY